MPNYEYRCEACKEEFTVVMTLAQHDKGNVICPKCQSNNVVQSISIFTSKTSRKS